MLKDGGGHAERAIALRFGPQYEAAQRDARHVRRRYPQMRQSGHKKNDRARRHRLFELQVKTAGADVIDHRLDLECLTPGVDPADDGWERPLKPQLNAPLSPPITDRSLGCNSQIANTRVRLFDDCLHLS